MTKESYYVLFNDSNLFLNENLVLDSNLVNAKKFLNVEEAENFNRLYYNNRLSLFHLKFEIDYNYRCLIDESLWNGANDHFE